MTLYVIGTGPGDISYMSQRAVDIIKKVDCIAGYTTYIKLINDLAAGKEVISTGMTKEVLRVEKAIEIALTGRSCALISGGDPGIYAMAGLVFEICQQRGINLLRTKVDKSQKNTADESQTLTLEIIPGIPALAAGAA
ncbi:MAG: precorrin-3B C(17)-methyltransferase, partial [Desulfobacula sp.]|nr:precorrin-3B C(17)-methyltransferase [Desulfobacula sp.]